MGVENLPIYNLNGRYIGSYVYMLLCQDRDGPIYIKIGIAQDPLKRVGQLRTGCPITPHQLFYINVRSREIAKQVESRLLKRCRKWRNNGEWLIVSMDDKSVFNKIVQGVLDEYDTPDWHLKWNRISMRFIQRRSKKRKQRFFAGGKKSAEYESRRLEYDRYRGFT